MVVILAILADDNYLDKTDKHTVVRYFSQIDVKKCLQWNIYTSFCHFSKSIFFFAFDYLKLAFIEDVKKLWLDAHNPYLPVHHQNKIPTNYTQLSFKNIYESKYYCAMLYCEAFYSKIIIVSNSKNRLVYLHRRTQFIISFIDILFYLSVNDMVNDF